MVTPWPLQGRDRRKERERGAVLTKLVVLLISELFLLKTFPLISVDVVSISDIQKYWFILYMNDVCLIKRCWFLAVNWPPSSEFFRINTLSLSSLAGRGGVDEAVEQNGVTYEESLERRRFTSGNSQKRWVPPSPCPQWYYYLISLATSRYWYYIIGCLQNLQCI